MKEVVLKIANELERRSNKKIIGRLKFGTLEYRAGEVMTPKLNNTKISCHFFKMIQVNFRNFIFK